VKAGTKLLLGVVVAGLVIYSISQSNETQKASVPLDYSKPVYTTDHAIICPLALLNDRRANHDIAAVMDMYTSTFTAESKAEKLGCEVWKSGVEVAAKPMDGMAPLVMVNASAFTVGAHLTNDPEGKIGSEDSKPSSLPQTHEETFDNSKTYINTTPTSPIPPSNGTGTILVSAPSKVPILKGDVKAANLHGFGAVICPDSKIFAAFVDIPNQNSDQEADQSNKKATSDIDTFRRYGCSYFPPDTPMVSDGGDPSGSLISVKVGLHDGRTVTGVTFSNWIVQSQEQVSGPPTVRTATPQETAPVQVDAVVAWTDPATGLMWTKKDYGVDVTWQEATDYCRNLQIGGQSDWRLPTINELQGIYDSSISAPDPSSGGQAIPWQVKGKLLLSAWGEWSSSQGNTPGQAWVFGFGSGKPFLYRFDGRKKPRALCVRGTRE
jgi:hypothetical protein